MPNAKLEAIHRFPVKGFAGHSLTSTTLTVDEGVPHDRRYAITNGSQADTGEWMSSRSFIVNLLHDGLLNFEVTLTDNADQLIFRTPSGDELTWMMGDNKSLSAANSTIAKQLEALSLDPQLHKPQIIERAATIGNWDFPDTPISLINMQSVAALSDGFNLELDAARFRGNLLIRDLPAWDELGFLGKRLQIGTAELDVMRPIRRCPTPGVNPKNGERDIKFAEEMPKLFGHAYCGMYAKVVKTGKINTSSTITVIGDAELPLAEALASDNSYPLWPRILEITTYEVGETQTRISLKNTVSWPLPEAKASQRLRFHMAPNEWTTEYITGTSPDHYHLEISRSDTDDPITERLRTGYGVGDQLVISGPFGRV